ncbi:hypothetical protein Tco_0711231, partial [Tanacetum coccineum]
SSTIVPMHVSLDYSPASNIKTEPFREETKDDLEDYSEEDLTKDDESLSA